VEPTFQAPAPWAPTAYPPTTGSTAFAPPGGPPVFGSPGLPNGSVHDPSSPRPRRRILLTVVIAIVVVALVAAITGVFVSGGSNSTTPTQKNTAISPAARQLLQSALSAAGQVNSFHYVATSTVSGPNGYTQKTIGDAGPDSGQQDITVGAQKFTVLVVGTACYLKGNAAALTTNLGLSSVAATAHTGQWISLARTDGPYASVYAAVTAPSALADNITITPENQLPPTKVDGRRVVTISGAIAKVHIAGQTIAPKGTAALAVRSAAPHLPVRYTENGTVNSQQTVSSFSFSHWGKAVHVTAPSGAVPYASLPTGSGSVPSSPTGTVLT
jgi:hypothetical protein